eukprot:428584-Rhodomonas_salina.1
MSGTETAYHGTRYLVRTDVFVGGTDEQYQGAHTGVSSRTLPQARPSAAHNVRRAREWRSPFHGIWTPFHGMQTPFHGLTGERTQHRRERARGGLRRIRSSGRR